MSPETLRRARVLVPIAALIVSVTTLVTCVIIAKTNNIYLSGLFWPFFSWTGRDAPAYYVFCTGLTIAAVLLAATWTFNYQYQRAVLTLAQRNGNVVKKYQIMTKLTLFAGCISVIGLSMLAFFDVGMHPQIHSLSAYWFFGWEVVATLLNTVVSKKVYNLALRSEVTTASNSNYIIMEAGAKSIVDEQGARTTKRQRTFRIQLALNVIFVIAFFFYIPYNFIAPSKCPMLTVQECLDRDLGVEYCTVTMRETELETKLQNCEMDKATPQLRALAQLTCVLMMISYCATFMVHDYEDAERDEAENNNLEAL